MPSPYAGGGPLTLYVKLSAAASAVEWKLYSRAFVLMAQGSTGAGQAGWSQMRLPGPRLSGVNGLFFLTLRARGQSGGLSAPKTLKLWVAR